MLPNSLSRQPAGLFPGMQLPLPSPQDGNELLQVFLLQVGPGNPQISPEIELQVIRSEDESAVLKPYKPEHGFQISAFLEPFMAFALLAHTLRI